MREYRGRTVYGAAPSKRLMYSLMGRPALKLRCNSLNALNIINREERIVQLELTYYQANANGLQNLLAKLGFKRELLRLAAQNGIDGFTLLKAVGAWQGKTEPSFQVLIEGVPKAQVRALATDFRDRYNQDAVMLKDGRKVEFV